MTLDLDEKAALDAQTAKYWRAQYAQLRETLTLIASGSPHDRGIIEGGEYLSYPEIARAALEQETK